MFRKIWLKFSKNQLTLTFFLNFQIGHIDEYQEPLIVCGCGTTIWGINQKGEDIYWTTLGDEINTLAICDIDSDDKNEVSFFEKELD